MAVKMKQALSKTGWLPLVVLTALGANYAQAKCLNYGRVTMRGTLTRQVFRGPPDYESIAHGDTSEIYYVLKLRSPTCVSSDPTDKEDHPFIRDLNNVQLVLSGSDQYFLLGHMIGKKLTLSGGLFGALTGHTTHQRY
jgi:hypothetical protein